MYLAGVLLQKLETACYCLKERTKTADSRIRQHAQQFCAKRPCRKGMFIIILSGVGGGQAGRVMLGDTILASTHTKKFCTSYHGNTNLERKETDPWELLP